VLIIVIIVIIVVVVSIVVRILIAAIPVMTRYIATSTIFRAIVPVVTVLVSVLFLPHCV